MPASLNSWAMLPPEIAAEVEHYAVERDWPDHAIIFRQGEECHGLHILQRGMVKLFIANREGREQTLYIQSEPGPVTLLPLLDGQPYAQSGAALRAARTSFLAAADFQRLYADHPAFAAAVQAEHGRRMRAVISVTDMVTLRPVVARIAWYLEARAQEPTALEAGGWFEIPVSQEELARLVGTTRESVARALKCLQDAQAIDRKRSKVRVLDALALREWTEHTNTFSPPSLADSA